MNKELLKTELTELFEATANDSSDLETAKDAFIDGLAGIMINLVKSATITYTSGLTAGANPVVGTFGNNIS